MQNRHFVNLYSLFHHLQNLSWLEFLDQVNVSWQALKGISTMEGILATRGPEIPTAWNAQPPSFTEEGCARELAMTRLTQTSIPSLQKASLVVLSGLIGLLEPGSARAATNIAGGNVINQTWTQAAGPYIVHGDVVVPSGAYLHIEAGTVVQFQASDDLGTGLDTNRIEITVNGTLHVNGTESNPVRFEPVSGQTPGTWYGIVVTDQASSVSVTHAEIRYPYRGIYSQNSGEALTGSHVTIMNSAASCLAVTAGHTTLDFLTAVSCGDRGVSVTSQGRVDLTHCLVTDNLNDYGIYIYSSNTQGSSVTNCTLDHNRSGIGVSNNGKVVVVNSILTNNTYW